MRPVTYLAAAGAAAAVAALLFAFVPGSSQPASLSGAGATSPAEEPGTPAGIGRCRSCHADVVTTYAGHGMSRSIGPAGTVPPGTITNPRTGSQYEISQDSRGPLLTATTAAGGMRRQRLVGRIGAGIFDTSWVGAEIDAVTGATTERLFFAPVETVTGHGLELSPFDLHAGSPGMDQPLTNECLTCHTTDTPSPPPFPANDLGADAFTRLSPLTCTACHGDVDRHVDIMSGRSRDANAQGLGIARLGRLTPGAQRDICARCHLQGDARIELVRGATLSDHPIAAQIPVIVPRGAHTDFRFVGQLERLALSACFKNAPAMTCTTCHDPHTAASAQGVAQFDAACRSCHQSLGRHPRDSSVPQQAEHAGRTEPRSCVACHVRRSQPFDLPHVRTADHFIRRQIEPPATTVPHRQFSARDGDFDLYDDGRLATALNTAAGRRWRSGVMAMGLLTFGRFGESARHFAAFPAPGTDEARAPSAPPGFAPLETHPAFHTARGFAMIGAGNLQAARDAFADAIAVDPRSANARLARARLSLDAGDIRTAMIDTQAVIDMYPRAEQPWDLRVEIAQRVGRPDLALTAADASTRLWPSNAQAWTALAVAAEAGGNTERARKARERATALTGRPAPASTPAR
jgi:predicted CXXCH cytochrome family protein